jgi:hypothetical protein
MRKKKIVKITENQGERVDMRHMQCAFACYVNNSIRSATEIKSIRNRLMFMDKFRKTPQVKRAGDHTTGHMMQLIRCRFTHPHAILSKHCELFVPSLRESN